MTDRDPHVDAAPTTLAPPPGAERFGQFLSRHHALLLVGLGALLNLWVVLSVRWLPIQDVGGHIEIMDIMARATDPGTIYPEMYQTSTPWTANGLCLVLATLFGGLVSAITIAKLLIAFYVVALPLSILSLARAFDRPPWLALFACPLVFSAVFGLGFLNFMVAMPMLFWSISLGRKYAEKGGWKLGLGLTLLMATTVLAHIIAYMMTIAMVFVMIYLHLPSMKRALRLSPVFLSTPIFLKWVYERILANTPTEAGRTFVGANEGFGTTFYSLDQRIDTLHQWGFRFLKSGADDFVLILLLLAWLVLLGISMRDKSPLADSADKATGFRAILRNYALELMIVCCLVGYFVLPNHLREVAIISERAWFIGIFFLALLPRARLTAGTSWIAAVLLIIAVAFPIVVQRVVKRFDDEVVGGLPEAIAALPDKTALAYVKTVHEIENVYQGPHWHIPKALHAVHNGGYTDDNFAIRPYFPVDFRPGKTPGSVSPAFWHDNNLFDWDHVLLYQASEPTAALNSSRLKLRWSGGPWWLFDVIVPENWNVPIAGGLGGSANIDTCSDDRVPVGLDISHDGKTLSSVRMMCRLTDEPPKSFELPSLFQRKPESPNKRRPPRESVVVSPLRGLVGDGHERAKLECPPQTRMTGIHGRADRMVRALGVICAKKDGSGRVSVEAVGGMGGEPFEFACPKGAARGLKTRLGWWIDGLGLVCRPGM
jgi:hypothetical protein